jgi:enoyl-CoA hydratase
MTNYAYNFINVDLNADGVAVCTMNRPDALNAINHEGHAELEALFAQVQRDPAVKAVVLTGAGRAFSAGGDVKGFGGFTDTQPGGIFDSGARSLAGNLVAIEKPVVAAVNGVAVGLGATIALLCDVVFMADTARIGDPHVKVGLVAGDGGVLFWPASMGMHRARRYLLTGDLLPAEEAWRFGLVTDLTETAEECAALAEKLVAKVAALPPIAVRGTKKSLNALMKARANEAFELSMAYEFTSGGSEDILEAVKAFKEKRKPVYHNR